MNHGLTQFIQQHQAALDQKLIAGLPPAPAGSEHLIQAMTYSLLNGGKRIRPLLVLATAEACGTRAIGAGELWQATPLVWDAAVAIEYVHAYSLIHDDLPAMDDDDLRRGKPTCHIAFDEASAILAGDALQCAAFELLSQHGNGLPLIRILAKASGASGMVAGQAIDLAAVNQSLSLEQLTHMHNCKTGALIRASVLMGAQAVNASAEQIAALTVYANAVGLAFQVQDDILDVTADTAVLGKQQGADAANNKPTYVSLLGLEQAQQKAQQLQDEALSALSCFKHSTLLADIAHYVVARAK